MKTFPAVRIEGGLFAPDLFDQLLAEELPGQKPHDFGLDGRRGLTDAIAAAFADARALWTVFCNRLARLPTGTETTGTGTTGTGTTGTGTTGTGTSPSPTTLTRDGWVIPFLSVLGYDLSFNRPAPVVGDMTFPISHRAGEAEDAPPIHIVSARHDLGRLPPSGSVRLAPHALVQEFLNRTDALWGIVTNGVVLRLLRTSTYIRRQSYVEFDLAAIFDQHRFPDFVVLYRLLHRSRLPTRGADAQQCLLEQYYQQSVAQGGRVRDRLRDGVEECLTRLANGFLRHPHNTALRRRLESGDGDVSDRITPAEFYRQLLRLVYRFLFLLVAEARGLISQHPLYLEHYSVSRLRRHITQRAAATDHDDLWLSLQVLWRLLSDDTPRGTGTSPSPAAPLAALLDLPVLNGDLFRELVFDDARITNRDLLDAMRFLALYHEKATAPPQWVNYAALDVEELGSVYESLLDYHPMVTREGARLRFALIPGAERKSTGSYYTPPELVMELIRSALAPAVAQRLKGTGTSPSPTRHADPERRAQALLAIRVLDPACGSGHFLLAAARYLGRELARVRTTASEPSPEAVRDAIREVVAQCIYGVDKNPLAVDLCRVALWIEAHTPGKPLTFLDHRIRCGDSLVGVVDLRVLTAGIPDEALTPVSGDDPRVAAGVKQQNKRERSGQRSLFAVFDAADEVHKLAVAAQALNAVPDDTPEQIRAKQARYHALQQQLQREWQTCDLWTAAFFQRFTPGVAPITTETLRAALEIGVTHGQVGGQAQTLAAQHRFFHWPLAFPEVFAHGGFDVVLGNPPWERIKLQEQEFFAARDPAIAQAANKAARDRLIRRLADHNPDLWREYQDALHSADALSAFLRHSGRFPHTGRGDINTYSVFAELARHLLAPHGRAGIVVPTGIATDDTNKRFFGDLVQTGGLVSLFDFENRERLFPAVISQMKFALLTMSRAAVEQATFAFFCTRAEQVHEDARRVILTPDDLALLNPNTRTMPIFRTRADADLTRAIYRRVPVLVNEAHGANPWRVTFRQGLFNMTSDSHSFRSAQDLAAQGFRRDGNRFVRGETVYLPLYEAKLIWQFDHRFATYDDDGAATRDLSAAEHADPTVLPLPRYWVSSADVAARLARWNRGWVMGWRDVTNATNERTVVAAIVPRVGVGDKFLLMLPDTGSLLIACLFADQNSLAHDYVARQKVGGVSLKYFTKKQITTLPPTTYTPADLAFIVPRVLELVYTAWDLTPFAADLWRDADDALRAAMAAQHQANGGHPDTPPDRVAGSYPFPPFRWDDGRRAILRAELDAYYARLYGLTRKQLRYILDPADLTAAELANILDPTEEVADPLDPDGYARRAAQSTFPGETFRVLKEKEQRRFGEYRTRRLVLEAWGRMQHNNRS